MSKKNLSDLLREEAHREPEKPTPQPPTPETVVKGDGAEITALQKQIETLTAQLEEQKKVVALNKEQAIIIDNLSTERNQLQTQLKAQIQSEKELTARVKNYDKDIKELKNQLKESQKETKEQAKKVDKLTGELNQSREELSEQNKLVEKLYHQIQLLETPPEPEPAPKPVPVSRRPGFYNAGESALVPYTGSKITTPSLSDEDIGWFD